MTPDLQMILQAVTAVAVTIGLYFTYRSQALAAQAKLAANLAALTARDAQTTAVETRAALAEVAISIDGNLHRMLELTERSARAEGQLEGQATGRKTSEAQEDRAHAVFQNVQAGVTAAPVDVETISPVAAQAIAEAMQPGTSEAVHDAITPPERTE